LIGFFGCVARADAAAERTLARMAACAVVKGAPITRVGARCAWFGPRDAAGASDGRDWVVVAGYARAGSRVLSPRAMLAHLQSRGARAMGELSGELALAACIDGTTFVARDRYGTRPLYFARAPGGHVFATAIGPLLAAGAPREVDRGAVVTSLVLGYVPAPATVLAGVRQVEPGQVVELRAHPRARTYYVPREKPASRALDASARALDRALTRAVGRAPASGRVGAFLSGGLDSSLVLARLRELGRDVEAYTLHFGDALPSEIRYALAVARHHRVRHHVLELGARAFCDAIDPALVHLEDLLSEPIAVPNFLLAREVARTKDVVFTGEGGDPIFGGPKNVGMVLERAYGARRLGYAYMSSHHHLADDLDEALTPEWRRAFDREALARRIEARILPKPRESFVGRLMVQNLAMKGGSNILVKVSKMVGAHGLALRSPLFDPLVVELGLTIPAWHKLEGTDEKIVLKRAVARSLPHAVLHRPKRGMGVPLRAWLDGALGDLARDVLTSRRVKERGIFRPAYVKKLLALESLPGDLARSRVAEKLWLVLICELHQRALERSAGRA
jgi:asparagine synthase (glutamine-hydrolysing)